MLDKIAQGIKSVALIPPQGFKWMAKKIRAYEEMASIRMLEEEGVGLDFDATELFTRMDILSRYSTCCVLAAEESYGYLPLDLYGIRMGMPLRLRLQKPLRISNR